MAKKKTRLESGSEPGAGKNPEFKEQIIRTKAEAKKKGTAGGKKSGEVRREKARAKRDARETIRFILDLAAEGQLDDNLKKMGVDVPDRTNMAALHASLFTYALRGDLEAYKTLMKMAGFDPEEERKERESVSGDKRRDMEADAKVKALARDAEGLRSSINMKDEDGDSDVVIYLPDTESEESCQMAEDGNSDTEDGEAVEPTEQD